MVTKFYIFHQSHVANVYSWNDKATRLGKSRPVPKRTDIAGCTTATASFGFVYRTVKIGEVDAIRFQLNHDSHGIGHNKGMN